MEGFCRNEGKNITSMEQINGIILFFGFFEKPTNTLMVISDWVFFLISYDYEMQNYFILHFGILY